MISFDCSERLQRIARVIEEGPYQEDWGSLATHPVPAFYQKARLGIFLHWGVFSVPAYHDWYARNMYIQGTPEYQYHLSHYGEHTRFGWKDFVPYFTMQHFDPEAWAELFQASGADYVIPVAEHHDGFQNYASDLSCHNALQEGPHRDILGDLLQACRARGLTGGLSSHRAEHWWFLSHGHAFPSDVPNPVPRDHLYWPAMPEGDHQDMRSQPWPNEEFLQDWLLRCCELVDRYSPHVIYFDWWIQHAAFRPYLLKFAAYYYNTMAKKGGCVINYKEDAFPFGTAVPDMERGSFQQAQPFVWQSDTSVMRGSWCYTEQSRLAEYKTPKELIQNLVDVVSKNGRLLLNFGPDREGRFREEDLHIFKQLSAWMGKNREAVQALPWKCSGEGAAVVGAGQFSDKQAPEYTQADFRFTVNGQRLYAVAMDGVAQDSVCIRTLGSAGAGTTGVFHGIIRGIRLLDDPHTQLAWQRDEEGLHISTCGIRTDLPAVFCIDCL